MPSSPEVMSQRCRGRGRDGGREEYHHKLNTALSHDRAGTAPRIGGRKHRTPALVRARTPPTPFCWALGRLEPSTGGTDSSSHPWHPSMLQRAHLVLIGRVPAHTRDCPPGLDAVRGLEESLGLARAAGLGLRHLRELGKRRGGIASLGATQGRDVRASSAGWTHAGVAVHNRTRPRRRYAKELGVPNHHHCAERWLPAYAIRVEAPRADRVHAGCGRVLQARYRQKKYNHVT